MSDTTEKKEFKPYISSDSKVAEFTVKSVLLGAIFGIIFGAATVYLALKAGLTVSASIPIAVLAISIGRKFFKTTILENNIIQTTGSAGESIAAGVVFTLPGFLFLSAGSNSESFFSYWPIFFLAALGGILGTLMMIPLRRSLIVEEHQSLPYPEGTACASVLIAGEKGGDFAKTAYYGLAFAFAYAILQKIFHLIAEAPTWATSQANKFFPSATVNGEITPEYMGVGYIIGPKIAGVLVAGGVLAWLGLIPLLATLVPAETIAYQLVKLGYLKDVYSPGGPGGWDPLNMVFANTATAIYQAYVKQIGAGAVAAGGFITLLKTIPTIVSSFKSSLASMNKSNSEKQTIKRTDDDLSFKIVIFGSLGLILLMALLPQIPGDSVLNKLLIGVLVIIFGFFFVTVSSRIVGLIGTSSNPVSGMTIATLMGTCLIFISIGWTGHLYEPMALVVGSMICIAAANAGATSQDLKTGYIVGATPRYQQLALFVGAIVSAVVIGLTLSVLDRPTVEMTAQGITHAIGTETYPAPQGTLMATLIKGLLSFNLDWQFVLVGVFLAITIELCGVKSLSFAVGAYLPLSTTLPIFAGGAIKGLVEMRSKKNGIKSEDEELGKGNLFATGLVAGGALMGVIYAFLMAFESTGGPVGSLNMEEHLSGMLGSGGYQILGFMFFLFMGWTLYRIAISKDK
ncbi:MAG: peptide transporter [Sphingobacteriales bacterium 39-40-5]|uniref:OPT family oligopeptide transporter n=1 Tax=Daejeonella sp. TaxID=2805397 RepID=UPI000BD151EE|nr:OPT/YSL family transporter [Daejeonella sp.]OYZ33110.1 MAG: peptide transporter [Sphingobacteriales bacterium 16-39-50]OZA62291.1 MAG: peptide transporter [Sphingobacteriales bacterium 39-40-5]HQS50487.1 OPT/YSL family transporter [Daejeonella sp.]HQT21670.1 OPT/YSL family transporter [Daejeonella sp.]HQT56401.1 OPT/YSL family transporter [Daejeonella sp.]